MLIYFAGIRDRFCGRRIETRECDVRQTLATTAGLGQQEQPNLRVLSLLHVRQHGGTQPLQKVIDQNFKASFKLGSMR